MNLLGTGAIVTTVACLVLGLAGGAALHHLIRRRGLLGILAHLLVTALSCTLIVFGVALELNRENGWYSSTSDLTGGTDAGGDLAVKVTKGHDTAGPLPSPGKRIQRFVVSSADGKMSNHVYVLLPNGYFDAANAKRRYPVLFLGHGMPGSVVQWLASMDIRKPMDPMVAAHTFGPTIVVIPAMENLGGIDTECVFGPNGPDEMEKWLTDDVPNFVEGYFRVQSSPQSWAMMGFSAGGWCSAMMTMLHPNRFTAAISLGGYFQPQWAGPPPFALNSPEAKRLDLIALARSPRPPAVAVFAQSTLQDPESGPSTEAFVKAARPPLQVTPVIDKTGGHRTSVWLAHVPAALTWLANIRPAFRG